VTQAFFVTLAMAALVLALGKDRKFFWLWGSSIALAILTKSAFGLFPLIVTFLFLASTRRWRILANPHFWGGMAVISAVTGAWVWTQYSAGGQDFINVHFKFIIMSKVMGGEPQQWTEYFGFLKDLATFYWPWLPFAAYGLFLLATKDLHDKDTSILLILWSMTVLVVMSFMRTRYQSYPALALVSAYALGKLVHSERTRLKLTKFLLGLCLAVTLLLNILPVPLDRDRERDTRILAPYVKQFAGHGAKVVALREDYWGLNNALLFFSDHAAEPLFTNPLDLAKAFDTKDLVICLAHRGDVPEIQKDVKEWYPVKYADDLILIANQKLDSSDVKTDSLN
jgi:4-amino-4-deoxy-L-arabinose transferase-like glycosyltransferase